MGRRAARDLARRNEGSEGMVQMRTNTRRGRRGVALLLAIGLAGAGFSLLLPGRAVAEVEDLAPLKAHWQARYRSLRVEEARLVKTVELATKEYADSNRRTYRRSGVRHFHRTNANEAKAQLAIVREQIAALPDELRAAGGYQRWLDEVDDEAIDMDRVEGLGVYADDGEFGGKGAYSPDAQGELEEDAARIAEDDGRNPIHAGESDDSVDRTSSDDDLGGPASADSDSGSQPGFDYESWRANRSGYEAKRAPENHLAPESPAEDPLEERDDPR